MNYMKNGTSWLLFTLAGVLLFAAANLYVFSHVVNGPNIKSALAEQNFYQDIVPAALETAGRDNAEIAGGIPLDDPGIKSAAEKAFPADELKKDTEQILDATFAWLEGETERPQFRIDLSDNKERLAAAVGSHVEKRLAGLPTCGPGQLTAPSDAYDVYTASCLPPGVSPAVAASSVANEIRRDREFLQNPVLTADQFNLDPTGTQDPTDDPFASLEETRNAYQSIDAWFWVLLTGALLLAVGGYFLSRDNLHKAATLAILSLSGLAISFLLLGILAGPAFDYALDSASAETAAGKAVGPVLTSLSSQARNVYWILAAIAGLVALALFFLRRRSSSNAK